MPTRCGCADNCSCLITAGEGVAVGGLGTIEQPYVIDVDPVPATDSLTFRPTGTVEFRTTGAGTGESPLNVFADAKVGMRELTDVLASDVPVTGDVVTWVTDHWEFRPQSGLPPGGTTNQVLAKRTNADGDAQWITIPAGGGATVSTGNGVGGDGSVTTPVALRNSGTWPLANYPADMSGLLGRDVFVDSAGNVRSRPDVIFSNTTAKLVTDLIGTYPIGTTVLTLTAAQGANWPTAGSGTVVTTRRADGAIGAQWCCRDTALTPTAWYRSGNATAWSPWVAAADPALPVPSYTEYSGDINVAATTTVETSPTVRLSIANPHLYRRMLVQVTLESWVAIVNTATYVNAFIVSGSGTWAVVNTTWRQQSPTSTNQAYESMKLTNTLWVNAGATVVVGIQARRLGGTVTLRTPRTIAVPLRYE